MSETDRDGISAKLLRLPGQFLLALINATAILVMVSAIFAIVAIVRIENLAENVVGTMTEAVLSKTDLPSKDVLANLQNLTKELRALGDALRDIKAGENPTLQNEVAKLREALTGLNVTTGRLATARTILTDGMIGELGRSVTDALIRTRGCTSTFGKFKVSRISS